MYLWSIIYKLLNSESLQLLFQTSNEVNFMLKCANQILALIVRSRVDLKILYQLTLVNIFKQIYYFYSDKEGYV